MLISAIWVFASPQNSDPLELQLSSLRTETTEEEAALLATTSLSAPAANELEGLQHHRLQVALERTCEGGGAVHTHTHTHGNRGDRVINLLIFQTS